MTTLRQVLSEGSRSRTAELEPPFPLRRLRERAWVRVKYHARAASLRSWPTYSGEIEDDVSIVGRTYLERGQPVVVLVQWGRGGGPGNVLIERVDGSKFVRPFRGLRVLDRRSDGNDEK